MSKPEAGSEQNLEDILASIRKSLVDEATEDASVARKPAAEDADRRDGLSSRLAGALTSAGSSLDGALAAFLAHVPAKDAPHSTAPAAQAAKSPSPEPKDPLWFLARPGAALDVPPAKDDSAPVKPTAASSDEIHLSRPETLRPSLPPLFVAKTGVTVPAASGPEATAAPGPAKKIGRAHV